MKKISRVLCFLIVVTLTVAMFGGCKKDPNADTPAGDLVAQYLSKADINFVTDEGESTYCIVRPDGSSEKLMDIAKVLFQGIKSTFVVTPKNVSDIDKNTDTAEILLGKTNRDASKKAQEILEQKGSGRSAEFVICSIDNDIAIYSTSDAGMEAAVTYFIENFLSSETLTGGIYYANIVTEGFTDINLFGTTKLHQVNVVRPIYNVSWLTQEETNKLIDFVLEKTGYTMPMVNDQIASTNYRNNSTAQTDGSGTLTPSAAAEYEIIIGNCVRDGVKSFTDHDEYEIRIEDKKIYLNGGSPYATTMAVSEFLKIVESNATITKDMSVIGGNYNNVIDNYDMATYYRPTWFDEFDGTEIDTTKWTINWYEVAFDKNPTTGKQGYRGNEALKNNYVKDGKLYFDGIETEDGYYGGLITTYNLMDYLYGYTELSNIHPKGETFWACLYTVARGDNRPSDLMYHQEVDIEEGYGSGVWVYQNSIITPTDLALQTLGDEAKAANRVVDYYSKDDRGLWMDFHTFGFNWISDTHIQFTVDGYISLDFDDLEGAERCGYSSPVNFRLGYSVGSAARGVPEPQTSKVWTESNSYINDYIYVYQLKGHELFVKQNGVWKHTVY